MTNVKCPMTNVPINCRKVSDLSQPHRLSNHQKRDRTEGLTGAPAGAPGKPLRAIHECIGILSLHRRLK